LLSALTSIANPLGAAEPAPAVAALTYSGDQSAIEAIDRDITAAGKDAAALGRIETSLVAVLRRTDATFAARQAVAQRLALVLASGGKIATDTSKLFATLLVDARDSDLARLALEPVPGDAADTLLVNALEKAPGRTRLGLIDSLSRRRAAAGVAALGKLLKDSDETIAAAAAKALGQIADPQAAAALHAIPEPSRAAVAEAKLAAAARMPPAAALGLLNDLQRSARDPVHRAAAFRQSLDLEVGTSTAKILDALGGGDRLMQQVALESVATSRAPNLVASLAGKLDSWDAYTQSAVIGALARRADPVATSAISIAATHPDALVRSAAIEALGFLPGTRDTATLLARIASESEGDEARAARQSLARLTGPEVATTILAGAEHGDPKLRAVYLEQLAARNMADARPLLLKTRADPDASVRAAAVGALGEIAPASEQKALLDWAIEATDATEQTRALRSVVNVTLRNPDVDQRGRALYALIEPAQPELALRLLPALGRIGGRASAESAAKLALRDDAKVAEAATTALTRWTDDTALDSLATVSEKASQADVRAAALEGLLRYFERNRDGWAPESTTLVARLLGSNQDPDVRKKLVRLLHRAKDTKALALLDTVKSDSALETEIGLAKEVVRANLAGKPRVRASNPMSVSNILDGKTSTRWTTPALGEEWIEVDFNVTRPVLKVMLDQTGRGAEFPEQYEVYLTDTPKDPGKPLATGAGQRNSTVIDLPAGSRGRYLIVKNVAERKDTPWAICELYVE
jgi:HEAT repeat protein